MKLIDFAICLMLLADIVIILLYVLGVDIL